LIRRVIALLIVPAGALVVWMFVVIFAYGSIGQAPNPVAEMFYLLPFVYLSYVVGYGVTRLACRAVPAAACVLACCALLTVCAWRMPAFAHGVNGSNRQRQSHIAVWTLLVVVPSIGGLSGSVPDLWKPRPLALPREHNT
jgi:hypothetical protein